MMPMPLLVVLYEVIVPLIIYAKWVDIGIIFTILIRLFSNIPFVKESIISCLLFQS